MPSYKYYMIEASIERCCYLVMVESGGSDAT